jgi:hypothetical protein
MNLAIKVRYLKLPVAVSGKLQDMAMLKHCKQQEIMVVARQLSAQSRGFNVRASLAVRLHRDERGEHAMEVLMILAFGVLPMIGAVWLLEDIIREYVAFGQIFITSPFF